MNVKVDRIILLLFIILELFFVFLDMFIILKKLSSWNMKFFIFEVRFIYKRFYICYIVLFINIILENYFINVNKE